MNTITISVTGEEFETLAVELTAEEVGTLYKLRKTNQTTITELEKKLKDVESTQKYTSNNLDTARKELNEAHGLLTALGVPLTSEEEDSYRRVQYPVSTRIALSHIPSKQ